MDNDIIMTDKKVIEKKILETEINEKYRKTSIYQLLFRGIIYGKTYITIQIAMRVQSLLKEKEYFGEEFILCHDDSYRCFPFGYKPDCDEIDKKYLNKSQEIIERVIDKLKSHDSYLKTDYAWNGYYLEFVNRKRIEIEQLFEELYKLVENDLKKLGEIIGEYLQLVDKRRNQYKNSTKIWLSWGAGNGDFLIVAHRKTKELYWIGILDGVLYGDKIAESEIKESGTLENKKIEIQCEPMTVIEGLIGEKPCCKYGFSDVYGIEVKYTSRSGLTGDIILRSEYIPVKRIKMFREFEKPRGKCWIQIDRWALEYELFIDKKIINRIKEKLENNN